MAPLGLRDREAEPSPSPPHSHCGRSSTAFAATAALLSPTTRASMGSATALDSSSSRGAPRFRRPPIARGWSRSRHSGTAFSNRGCPIPLGACSTSTTGSVSRSRSPSSGSPPTPTMPRCRSPRYSDQSPARRPLSRPRPGAEPSRARPGPCGRTCETASSHAAGLVWFGRAARGRSGLGRGGRPGGPATASPAERPAAGWTAGRAHFALVRSANDRAGAADPHRVAERGRRRPRSVLAPHEGRVPPASLESALHARLRGARHAHAWRARQVWPVRASRSGCERPSAAAVRWRQGLAGTRAERLVFECDGCAACLFSVVRLRREVLRMIHPVDQGAQNHDQRCYDEQDEHHRRLPFPPGARPRPEG